MPRVDAITSLTLAAVLALAVGCALRTARSPIPAAALLPCTQAECLRVVTWNLHAIPLVTPNPAARLRHVAAKIREQQPDLVLFQELWAHAYPRRLAQLLAGEYRVTTALGCGRPFPCGGLAVLVRIGSGWVASAPTFVPYEATVPWYRLGEWDGIAKKGMLLLHLTRDGDSLGVLDTHLQTEYARHRRDYSGVRRRQLEQLAWTLQATFGARPVIVGGDFNTAPEESSGLYLSHVAPLGDDRTAAFRNACGDCGTRPAAINGGRWLDYLITRNLTASAALDRIANDAVDAPFSDHDGLLVRLDYDRGALSAAAAARPECRASSRLGSRRIRAIASS